MKHADEDQGEDLPVKYQEIADQLEAQGEDSLGRSVVPASRNSFNGRKRYSE